MDTFRRIIADLLTLVRIPVLVLLAVVIDPDQPELACIVGLIGLASHYLDGVVVRGIEKPDSIWHMLDTAVLSLGLQLAAGLWLVRAEVFSWGWLPAYVLVVAILQFGYVQPRIDTKRPFVPIVLIGSVLVWNALAVMFAEQAGFEVPLVVAGLNGAIFLHLFLHRSQWKEWEDEARMPISAVLVIVAMVATGGALGYWAINSLGDDEPTVTQEAEDSDSELTKAKQVANDQARMTYKLYSQVRACQHLGLASEACADRTEAVDRYAKKLGYTPEGFDLPYPPQN